MEERPEDEAPLEAEANDDPDEPADDGSDFKSEFESQFGFAFGADSEPGFQADTEPAAPQRPRSTIKVLGGLLAFLVVSFGLLGLCVSTFVSSTPHRTLEVPRTDLTAGAPRFYPLPSFGADPDGNTFGVWVVLHDGGTADAFYSQDPQSGCSLPWRPELSFQGSFGWFRDACNDITYSIDGRPAAGPAARNIDEFDAEVTDANVIVDLERVRLGQCPAVVTNPAPCSLPGQPAQYEAKHTGFGE